MKRIIPLSLILILLLSLCAGCQKSGNGAKVGDVLDAPEKTAALSDFPDLTIIFESERFAQTLAVRHQENSTVYYTNQTLLALEEGQSPNDPDVETIQEEYVLIVRGTEQTVFTKNGSSWEQTNTQNINEETFATFFYWYGIGTYEGETFKKQEDAKVNGADCYVYEHTYKADGTTCKETISVDKKTGIWLKIVTPEEDGGTSTVAVQMNSNVIPMLPEVGMDEQVIYNKNNLTVTAKKLTVSDPNSAAQLLLQIKNESESDVRISSHVFEVNGLCLGQSVINGLCEKGKTTDLPINISSEAASVSGIELIKEISTRLLIKNVHIENSPDGQSEITDAVLEENTGDLKITTKAPKDYQQKIDRAGDTALNESGVKLTIKDLKKDEDLLYYTLVTFCENSFTEDVRIEITVTAVNGVAVEPEYLGTARMPAQSKGFTGPSAFRLSEIEGLKDTEEIRSVDLTYRVVYGGRKAGDNSIHIPDVKVLIEETNPITYTVK